MKQELFKEMYDEIHLNKEQKNRIWDNLETMKRRGTKGAGKRFHTPAFAAICICILLVISVPVLAANTSVVQSIINAFDTLNLTKPELTEEQKNIYAKYGNALDNEIELGNGTLKLEAIINDGRNICIPFSMKLKNIKEKRSNGILYEISNITFYFKNNQKSYEPLTKYATLNDKQLQKDGIITGCYLLYSDERAIKQGDVLQLKNEKMWENEEKRQKSSVISEITVNAPMKNMTVPVKSQQSKLPKGASIKKIQISPLSTKIEGIEQNGNRNKSIFNSEIKVILKDGSTVKDTSTGPSGAASDLDEKYYTYSRMILFEAPVNLDDVAGIQIQNASLDLWIPVED